MGKYRTAGRLIILSLVTSWQDRQRHWQFALQFLFAALHGQLDPVSRVTGIPGWYWILGIKCNDTTGVGLVY